MTQLKLLVVEDYEAQKPTRLSYRLEHQAGGKRHRKKACQMTSGSTLLLKIKTDIPEHKMKVASAQQDRDVGHMIGIAVDMSKSSGLAKLIVDDGRHTTRGFREDAVALVSRVTRR
ncbi:hypothetical protein FOPE_01685 [Fonsecaea pedrosoi]|nr:hypothetical protein FOPE_01685 [Fonsecaea pedrosoi]